MFLISINVHIRHVFHFKCMCPFKTILVFNYVYLFSLPRVFRFFKQNKNHLHLRFKKLYLERNPSNK